MKEKLESFVLKIRKNLNYNKVIKVLFFLVVIGIFISVLSSRASAGLLDYSGDGNSPFEGASGWGKFMGDRYRENYYLDVGDVGTFDILSKGINMFANIIFYVTVLITWLGLNVFNLCFGSDITEFFSSVLDKVSSSLQSGVLNNFFMIMFMLSLISIVIFYAKRNYAAIFTQLLIVAIIGAIPLALTSSHIRNFVTETTSLSREIGSSLISNMNVSDSTEDTSFENSETSKTEMLGSMWSNLIHKPWIVLEFDGKYDTNYSGNAEVVKLSEDILSLDEDSSDRKEIVKEHVKDVSYTGRFASTLLLAVITIVKVVILIIIGVMQIFLQILAVGMVLLLPLFLLLAIVPFFGGLDLLKFLGEKYLGIQIGIVLLSFVISFLMLIDSVTLDFLMKLKASFIVALMIQTVCWILLVVNRKMVIRSLMRLQERISRGTSSYLRFGNKLFDKSAKAGEKVADPVKRKAVDFKDRAVTMGKYAGKYAAGNAKIYAAKKVAGVVDKIAMGQTKDNSNEFNKAREVNKNNNTKGSGKDINFEKVKLDKNNVGLNDNDNSVNKDNIYNGVRDVNKKESSIKDDGLSNTNNRVKEMKKELKEEKNEVNLTEEKNKKEERAKVLSYNKAREERGKNPVDSKAIKEELRQNLNEEVLSQNKKSVKTKEDLEAQKRKKRAEKLKSTLGVSNRQIKEKEKELKSNLNSIKTKNVKKI